MRRLRRFFTLAILLAIIGGFVYVAFAPIPAPQKERVREVSHDLLFKD